MLNFKVRWSNWSVIYEVSLCPLSRKYQCQCQLLVELQIIGFYKTGIQKVPKARTDNTRHRQASIIWWSLHEQHRLIWQSIPVGAYALTSSARSLRSINGTTSFICVRISWRVVLRSISMCIPSCSFIKALGQTEPHRNSSEPGTTDDTSESVSVS